MIDFLFGQIIELLWWLIRAVVSTLIAGDVLFLRMGLIEWCAKEALVSFFRWKFRLPVFIDSLSLAMDYKSGLAYFAMHDVQMHQPPHYICYSYKWKHKGCFANCKHVIITFYPLRALSVGAYSLGNVLSVEDISMQGMTVHVEGIDDKAIQGSGDLSASDILEILRRDYMDIASPRLLNISFVQGPLSERWPPRGRYPTQKEIRALHKTRVRSARKGMHFHVDGSSGSDGNARTDLVGIDVDQIYVSDKDLNNDEDQDEGFGVVRAQVNLVPELSSSSSPANTNSPWRGLGRTPTRQHVAERQDHTPSCDLTQDGRLEIIMSDDKTDDSDVERNSGRRRVDSVEGTASITPATTSTPTPTQTSTRATGIEVSPQPDRDERNKDQHDNNIRGNLETPKSSSSSSSSPFLSSLSPSQSTPTSLLRHLGLAARGIAAGVHRRGAKIIKQVGTSVGRLAATVRSHALAHIDRRLSSIIVEVHESMRGGCPLPHPTDLKVQASLIEMTDVRMYMINAMPRIFRRAEDKPMLAQRIAIGACGGGWVPVGCTCVRDADAFPTNDDGINEVNSDSYRNDDVIRNIENHQNGRDDSWNGDASRFTVSSGRCSVCGERGPMRSGAGVDATLATLLSGQYRRRASQTTNGDGPARRNQDGELLSAWGRKASAAMTTWLSVSSDLCDMDDVALLTRQRSAAVTPDETHVPLVTEACWRFESIGYVLWRILGMCISLMVSIIPIIWVVIAHIVTVIHTLALNTHTVVAAVVAVPPSRMQLPITGESAATLRYLLEREMLGAMLTGNAVGVLTGAIGLGVPPHVSSSDTDVHVESEEAADRCEKVVASARGQQKQREGEQGMCMSLERRSDRGRGVSTSNTHTKT